MCAARVTHITLESLGTRNFATTAEAAAILRCDPRTIRAMIARGELPAANAGAEFRIPVSCLRKLASPDGAA